MKKVGYLVLLLLVILTVSGYGNKEVKKKNRKKTNI